MRKKWIDVNHPELSICEQLSLLAVSKTAYYYEAVPENSEDLLYMEEMDKLYTEHPYYGSRRMVVELKKKGYIVNRKRVTRLMKKMGIEAIYPKPNLSKANKEHQKFPYLLNNFKASAPDQVWSVDITYIPLRTGFLYLVAIIDWYSRYVLSWRLSNTLDVGFCLEALEEALEKGTPEIFNSDQGVQFTSDAFTSILKRRGIQISMDGKGRALDNIFIERLWRSVKYEDVYIKRYEDGPEAYRGISLYMVFYNNNRPHQSLDYKTPQEVHLAA